MSDDQGHFTAQFFNFLFLFIFFPSWLLLYIVSDYCITSQENESRLVDVEFYIDVVMTMTKIMIMTTADMVVI